jgi:hypothetical protein
MRLLLGFARWNIRLAAWICSVERKEAGGDSRKNSDREMGGGDLGDEEKCEERREVERGI